MSKQLNNCNKHVIVLKNSITEADYHEINALQQTCNTYDKTNLKLELDFKRSIHGEADDNKITEFLYYWNDLLVAYLGICCFGGKADELNGMVHPDHRRNGYFKRLFQLAILECQKNPKRDILLLSDGACESGKGFIESIHGEYSFSEYRMRQLEKEKDSSNSLLNLRASSQNDLDDIANQNAVYFNTLDDIDSNQTTNNLERQEKENLDSTLITEQNETHSELDNASSETTSSHDTTYMIELENTVIGKICVDYSENYAFIFGFGIKPEYRGKGYGREALIETLKLIHSKNIDTVELDVECKNDTALNLYKSCGFVEQSVMNYYEYTNIVL